MTSPALLALTDPASVPAAAVARLLSTGSALQAASISQEAGVYAAFLAKSGAMSTRLSPVLASVVAGTATEAEVAALIAGERVARAGVRLCDEIAVRTTHRACAAAMVWASLHRRIYADVALVRREFEPALLLGLNLDVASRTAPVRVLSEGQSALSILSRDPLIFASSWDLPTLAATLASWVRVT